MEKKNDPSYPFMLFQAKYVEYLQSNPPLPSLFKFLDDKGDHLQDVR